ncbi:MAG TPA: septal ring lytic transglycosylase RlpA family protein, partial [bacterium]|nr:septal ring lytic transglycosylase RlpA family protein [bacterium]
TANGERFNMYAMTAAHRSLPFNTKVKITNLDNDKVAYVRINDRGPFQKNRIIDLSRAAAKELGFEQKGTARVRIEIL